MEAVPVNSDISKLRIGYRHFYSSYGVGAKDNRQLVPLLLGKGWVLVADSFGTFEGGEG